MVTVEPTLKPVRSHTTRSIKINFYIYSCDTGLDKLYKELCEINGVSECNHCVRRHLYNGYAANVLNLTPTNATLHKPNFSVPVLKPSHEEPVSILFAVGEKSVSTDVVVGDMSLDKRKRRLKEPIRNFI